MTALCWSFYCVNNYKEIDVKCLPTMKCILCYMNITKRRLILCNITNGIIALRKHVFTNHFIIVKMFEEEMNIPLKGETNREPTKKIFNLFNISNFKFLLQKNLSRKMKSSKNNL